MSWIYYLLEANLYLVLFYGFYRLLLHKETFYTLNRYYLVFSTITAFLLPFLQASYFHQADIPATELLTTGALSVLTTTSTTTLTSIQTSSVKFADLLPYLYLLVTTAFFTKIVLNILGILNILLHAKKERSGSVTYVTLDKDKERAFSFFNLLFINPSLEERQTVISHELVHIKQKHSIDILFFEFVRAICWFNPIAYLLKSDIRLLHEYLADELTIVHANNRHAYAMFLIRNSFGVPGYEITNHIFNQSILKRRINMLNKEKTTARARLRLLLLLPLAGTMVCLSTMAFTKDYGLIDLYPEKYSAAAMMQEPPPPPSKRVPPTSKTDYFSPYKIDPQTKKKTSTELKLIVINGKIVDNKKVRAIFNADKRIILKPAEAIKKYGEAGKYGAIEVTGKKVSISDELAPPPPKNNFKFPPPVVRNDSPHTFYFKMVYDKATKKMVRKEDRLIILNGNPIDYSLFGPDDFGLSEVDHIVYLSAAATQKKYGPTGRSGAVELTTKAYKIIEISPPPRVEPPPPGKSFKRFPPPVVKPDKKGTVRFPPPIVKQDKNETVKFPPPVVKPDKNETVKFPPPVVKPDKDETVKFPPPVVKPDKDEPVKFPPPVVKPDKPVNQVMTGIVESDITYTADSTKLDKKNKIVSMFGNVKLTVNGSKLEGDAARYYIGTGRLYIQNLKVRF